VGPVDTHRIGLHTALEQFGALVHAHAHLLGDVRRFRGRGGGFMCGHGS
jgi:hypothetical protein